MKIKLVGALITLIILAILIFQPQPSIVFLDVGQGLSILFSDTNEWQMLFDGGEGTAVLPKLAEEMNITDRHLNVIALSHTHRDHIEGLIEVLTRYQVDEVWWSGTVEDNDVFNTWQKAVENSAAKVTFITAGWERLLPSGWKITALHPPTDIVKDHPHDSGVVFQLSNENQTILLTGDLEKHNEEGILKLCQTSYFINCQTNNVWLQVSHHGSRNTTNDAWLEYWHPQKAIISAGVDNRYNHPHTETLDRLIRHQIPFFRTDQTGTISLPLTKN